MTQPSNVPARVRVLLLCCAVLASSVSFAQEPSGDADKVKPAALRIGVPNKHSAREVIFPLIVETSGTAAVGRIRAELELSAMAGWSFRGIELTRGLDLRSNVRRRNEGSGKLIVDWDVSAEGKELPAGHVALLRLQANKAQAPGGGDASDSPPALIVRKMSWGFAEFEKQDETLPQLNTPDNLTGNPDVSCFFFTH